MKKYTINLEASYNDTDYEEFEENNSNIALIKIQLPSGEIVENNGYKVYLELSKDAMIGLGVSLIRAAHRPESEYGFWQSYPMDIDSPTQNLGIYLHPKSCELLLSEDDFGTIDEISKEMSESE